MRTNVLKKELIYLLLICTLFILLRLPSLVEPYWYGDEGIYHVIGDALRHGRILYTDIWDNKPPLLYFLYAWFGKEQFSIRFLALLTGVITIPFFFQLVKKLLPLPVVPFIVTSIFSLLFATPYLEGNIANAENFMLLPIIAAGVLLAPYGFSAKHHPHEDRLPTKRLFVAGALLGVAFLMKMVAVFEFTAFFLFITIILLGLQKKDFADLTKPILLSIGRKISPYIIGFFVPIATMTVCLLLKSNFLAFIEANFISNASYVEYNNALFFPQGLLLLKSLLLILSLSLLYTFRKKVTPVALFVILWLIFSLFSAYFSHRPYTHYLLVVLPSLSLFIGLALSSQIRNRIIFAAAVLIILLFLEKDFDNYGYHRTFKYYNNFLSFVSHKKSLHDYQAFFDTRTPSDYELAYYLNNQLRDNETFFLWGNSAQVYTLSGSLPITRYTVAYHIAYKEQQTQETINALQDKKPRFIVLTQDYDFVPFPLTNYAYTITIAGNHIYERIY